MINVTRLRAMIGWLGMLLPWIVVVLLGRFPDSISETYWYQETIIPFMIILGSASILLMFYDGYDKKDDIINTIGSFFGLGILLFPCDIDGIANYGHSIIGWAKGLSSTELHELPSGIFMVPMSVSNVIHTVSAIAFFVILALNSIFQFTKTSGEITKNKKIRNIIYRVCGIGMLSVFLIYLIPIPYEMFRCKVWFIEMVALTFFGISWLTKANCYKLLFADKK